MSSREKAGDLVWLVKTGRSVIGSPSWDALATQKMSTISDAEINAALKDMFDLERASVLISCGGEQRDLRASQDQLVEFVNDVRSVEYAALDADWMQTLGGELLSGAALSGAIGEVTQHASSGTWGGTLSNGVRVWARPLENNGP